MSCFILSSYGLPSGPSELGLAGLSADEGRVRSQPFSLASMTREIFSTVFLLKLSPNLPNLAA